MLSFYVVFAKLIAVDLLKYLNFFFNQSSLLARWVVKKLDGMSNDNDHD